MTNLEGTTLSRRAFLGSAAAGIAGTPALIRRSRPGMPFGVAAGDVRFDRAVLWSCTDRPARMVVEYAATDEFRNAVRVRGPAALADTGFAAKLDLAGLPAGATVHYRVWFEDLQDRRATSEKVAGRLVTPARRGSGPRIVWSGDTCGQGWGIDRARGGMLLYERMRELAPDLFVHCGDLVYADNPIEAEVRLRGGGTWKNVVTEAKSKVAETLDEFRGQYRYNLLDDNLRRFNAEVAQVVTWDDHETVNNWFPNELLDDPRYTVKSCALLSARAKRAMIEHTPTRAGPRSERLHRVIRYGSAVDLFVLDMRSYRGDNSRNRQAERGPATAFLGADQLRWLQRALLTSRATWKVIVADMPIGLVVRDGKHFEACANADPGKPLGRELEIAALLRFLRAASVPNVVWITADVHYAAAHRYAPDRAAFQDFDPFWEFVAGPIHAGTFGPSELDATFGPQVVFSKHPPKGRGNLSPAEGMQFFGVLDFDAESHVLEVSLRDAKGDVLFERQLNPRS